MSTKEMSSLTINGDVFEVVDKQARATADKKTSKTLLEARLNQYKSRYEMYLKAEAAILEGAQAYSVGTRTLTRANLADIRNMLSTLESGIDELEVKLAGGGRRKCVRVIPRDV